MEFLAELNTLLIQDLGLTQELANISCGVVVGMSLFVAVILYFYIAMGLVYLISYCFKIRYYLILTKNQGFLIERNCYLSKYKIKSIEKKYGKIVLIERFNNEELLHLYMLQYDYDIRECYLGKDYKTVLDKMHILYGENENEKE